MSNKETNYMISDKDIKNVLGNKAKIVTYDELHKYKNLDELLGNKDIVLILYVHSIKNNSYKGHWSLLTRRNEHGKTIIEFDDSFGMLPDAMLDLYSDNHKKKTYQDKNYLSKFLLDAAEKGDEIHYNEMIRQRKSPNINTCGRFALYRALNKDIPLDIYQSFFEDLKKKGHRLDDAIVALTNRYL